MNDVGFGDPPLEWIRAFEAAARTGSFTEAARELGLTQSAVSQRIGNLERRLGCRLFLREARSIALTMEGEAWLPHVSAALMSLRDSCESLFGITRNQLVFSASESITHLWIVPRLRRFDGWPGMRVAVRTMTVASDQAPEDAILVRYGAGDWPDVHKAPLFDEVMTPVAAPSLIDGAASWRDLPRIAVSGPRPGWTEWAAQMDGPSTPVPVFRFDTFAGGLAAAREGLGVLLGSLALCARDLRSGTLVRLTEGGIAHHQTYWMLGARAHFSKRRWSEIEAVMRADP